MALTVRREADLGFLQKQKAGYPNIGPGSTPFGQMVIAGIQGATNNVQNMASIISRQAAFDRDSARAIISDKFSRHQAKITKAFKSAELTFARRHLDIKEEGLNLQHADIERRRDYALGSYQLKKKEITLNTIAGLTSAAFDIGAILYNRSEEKKEEGRRIEVAKIETQLSTQAGDIARQVKAEVAQQEKTLPGGFSGPRRAAMFQEQYTARMAQALNQALTGSTGRLTDGDVARLTNYNAKLAAGQVGHYAEVTSKKQRAIDGMHAEYDLKHDIRAGQYPSDEQGRRELQERVGELVGGGYISPQKGMGFISAGEIHNSINVPFENAMTAIKGGSPESGAAIAAQGFKRMVQSDMLTPQQKAHGTEMFKKAMYNAGERMADNWLGGRPTTQAAITEARMKAQSEFKAQVDDGLDPTVAFQGLQGKLHRIKTEADLLGLESLARGGEIRSDAMGAMNSLFRSRGRDAVYQAYEQGNKDIRDFMMFEKPFEFGGRQYKTLEDVAHLMEVSPYLSGKVAAGGGRALSKDELYQQVFGLLEMSAKAESGPSGNKLEALEGIFADLETIKPGRETAEGNSNANYIDKIAAKMIEDRYGITAQQAKELIYGQEIMRHYEMRRDKNPRELIPKFGDRSAVARTAAYIAAGQSLDDEGAITTPGQMVDQVLQAVGTGSFEIPDVFDTLWEGLDNPHLVDESVRAIDSLVKAADDSGVKWLEKSGRQEQYEYFLRGGAGKPIFEPADGTPSQTGVDTRTSDKWEPDKVRLQRAEDLIRGWNGELEQQGNVTLQDEAERTLTPYTKQNIFDTLGGGEAYDSRKGPPTTINEMVAQELMRQSNARDPAQKVVHVGDIDFAGREEELSALARRTYNLMGRPSQRAFELEFARVVGAQYQLQYEWGMGGFVGQGLDAHDNEPKRARLARRIGRPGEAKSSGERLAAVFAVSQRTGLAYSVDVDPLIRNLQHDGELINIGVEPDGPIAKQAYNYVQKNGGKLYTRYTFDDDTQQVDGAYYEIVHDTWAETLPPQGAVGQVLATQEAGVRMLMGRMAPNKVFRIAPHAGWKSDKISRIQDAITLGFTPGFETDEQSGNRYGTNINLNGDKARMQIQRQINDSPDKMDALARKMRSNARRPAEGDGLTPEGRRAAGL